MVKKKGNAKSGEESKQAAKKPLQPTSAGKLLEEKRKALGMTRKDVHNLTGISERTLGNWERGEREPGANAWLSVFYSLENEAQKRGVNLQQIEKIEGTVIEEKLDQALDKSLIFTSKLESLSGLFFGLKLHGFAAWYTVVFICDYCGNIKVHEVKPGEFSILDGCYCDEAKQRGRVSMSVQSIVPNYAKDFPSRRSQKPKAK